MGPVLIIPPPRRSSESQQSAAPLPSHDLLWILAYACAGLVLLLGSIAISRSQHDRSLQQAQERPALEVQRQAAPRRPSKAPAQNMPEPAMDNALNTELLLSGLGPEALHSHALGDFDGDGSSEVLVTQARRPGLLRFAGNTGRGQLGKPDPAAAGLKLCLRGPDSDRDRRAEILYYSPAAGETYLYTVLGQRLQTFKALPLADIRPNVMGGDGRGGELIWLLEDSGDMVVYQPGGSEHGRFELWKDHGFGPLCDADGDGASEIVCWRTQDSLAGQAAARVPWAEGEADKPLQLFYARPNAYPIAGPLLAHTYLGRPSAAVQLDADSATELLLDGESWIDNPGGRLRRLDYGGRETMPAQELQACALRRSQGSAIAVLQPWGEGRQARLLIFHLDGRCFYDSGLPQKVRLIEVLPQGEQDGLLLWTSDELLLWSAD
ncbi:hypothetical protein IT575_07995 [bacterium]|nr:hypothetical protein [bacterium]